MMMKGTTCRTVMSRPLIAPPIAPASKPASAATHGLYPMPSVLATTTVTSAMSEPTPAVRRDGVPPWELEPGEYAVVMDGETIARVWVRLPNGDGPSELHEWSPVINEDGTLTLSPSILSHPSGSQKGWHGWLERDVWREA